MQLLARTANTQVASGSHSCTIGFRNTASGSDTFAIGSGNTAGAGGSAFAFGGSNTASGGSSMALGFTNNAAGQSSTALGTTLTVTGTNALGTGLQSNTFSVTSRHAHAAGQFSTSGDNQSSRFRLRIATTDATPTVMTVDGAAAATNTRVNLQNNNTFAFTGLVVGKQTGSTNAASWKLEGQITRGANAAATVLDASTVTVIFNGPAWGTPTLTADATNGALILTITGKAATNIRWSAHIDTCEIIYA